jgi:phage gp45-like
MKKWLNTIIRRVLISAITDTAGQIKRVTATGHVNEEFVEREMFQHFGFTSRKDGAEAVVVGIGNVFFVIAEDDRVTRIVVDNGESCIYNDEGDKVHIKKGGIIEAVASVKVIASAPAVELGNGAQLALVNANFVNVTFPAHTHAYTDDGNPMVTGAPVLPVPATDLTEKTTAS